MQNNATKCKGWNTLATPFKVLHRFLGDIGYESEVVMLHNTRRVRPVATIFTVAVGAKQKASGR